MFAFSAGPMQRVFESWNCSAFSRYATVLFLMFGKWVNLHISNHSGRKSMTGKQSFIFVLNVPFICFIHNMYWKVKAQYDGIASSSILWQSKYESVDRQNVVQLLFFFFQDLQNCIDYHEMLPCLPELVVPCETMQHGHISSFQWLQRVTV